MKNKETISRLQTMLKDKAYRNTWQANLAMSFFDEYRHYASVKKGKLTQKDIHIISNNGAKMFLELLCQK